VEVEIPFAGKRRVISTHPQQMLSLLLSTYQAAVQRNIELAQTQDELTLLNEDLEAKVEQRTAALSNEIIERERLQAELRSLSLSDELTGLHNRRGFILLAEHHWRQALREGDEFALLYADLNDLKQINDAFGHSQGDQALCAIASIMKQTFRGCDTLARIGGDEFTALFANCDLETAQAAVIRLKKNLEQMNGNGPHLQNLSLSVGLAHFSPNNQVSINDLLEQADAAMYAHKKQLKERRAS
jgi:diguanylate cyclase (GGDEF)-like protein